MSLIHWWPLNGNITDNGVDNFTLSATPSFSAAGKIGKCATNTNISAGLTYLSNQTLPLAKDSPISIFTWVYMNDYSTTGANLNGLVSNHNHGHNGDKGSGFGLNLRNNGNSFQVSISTSSTGGRTFSTYCGNTTFSAGKWHHVGFTYNGSRINFYLDGNYDGGLNFTSSYNSNNPIGIFCWSTGYSGYSSSCQLNDVRIYNHALSTKEVKEISKGLVLHYNFEDCVNPNLFINSGNYTSASKATTSLPNTDGYQSWPIYYNNLVNGTTYTLSVDFDGVLSPRHGIQATPANRYCTIWLYFQDSNYTDSSYSSYTNPVCFTSGSLNHKQLTATRHQWTFTLGSDLAYYKCCAIRTNTYSDGSTPVTVNFWNFKLEKSNTSTAFSTNAENTAIVYDNSGYGNNGTLYGNTFAISSMTTSGQHSGQFDGTANSVIVAGQGAKITDEVTVSWLGYMTNWANYGRAISCTEGGGWNFEPASSKMQWPIYLAGIGYKSCQSIKNLSEFTSGWHLFTGTYDGFTSKLYIDGELQSSVTSGATAKTAIGYAASNSIFIGAEAAGSATTPTSPYFSGNIADIKIYSTALSAEDILAEYNRKAAIDKNGNLFTGEFIETNTNANIADKNNQIKATYFVEGKEIVKIFGGYTELDYFDQVNPPAGAASQHNRCQISDISYDHIEAMVKVTGKGSAGGIILSNNGNWWKTYDGQGGVNDGSGTVTMTPASFSQDVWTSISLDFSKAFSGLWTSGWTDSINYWTPQNLKVAYIKTYNGEELTGHFIPVKNKNNVIGLFNIITGKFYSNAGTGSFVAGSSLGNLSLIQENKIEEL